MLARLVPFLLIVSSVSHALDNGRAKTPPMGMNSWYAVLMNPTETFVRETAAAMKKGGFLAAGYNLINLDDGMVEVDRDANGRLVPDKTGFPNGFTELSSWLHSEGFLFGIYGCRGSLTCGGRAGQEGHEYIDAATYVDWGVDYFKEDSCNAPQEHEVAYAQYATMRDALLSTNSNITFSLCGWNPWYASVGAALGNLWRIGPDDTSWGNVLKNIDINAPLWVNAGPGSWNDPCLLLGSDVNGKQRITEQQSLAQFAMWATMSSPFLLSQDVRNLSAFLTSTYLNSEIIAVQQDVRGRQGQRVMGGNLAPSGGDIVQVIAMPCTTEYWEEGMYQPRGRAISPQRWSQNSPQKGFYTNVATGNCLNVDDCGTNVIDFECVTSKGSCCGDNCYDNEMFTSTSSHFTSALGGTNACVGVVGEGSAATLMPCSSNENIINFSFDSSTETIRARGAARDGSDLCLMPQSASSNATNVWAKPLADGAWAFTFLSNAPTNTSISCPFQGCIEDATGWPQDLNIHVRDLIHQKDVHANITVAAGISTPLLPPDGGVAMFRLTPIWPNTSIQTHE